MRILLVKTSSMGDVIHALPAVTDAARALPGIVVDWVVEEAFAEIPAWHPAVGQVIPVAIRRWRKAIRATVRNGEWRAFREQLARHHYDAVIDAQGLIKSAVIARLVPAPRYGYSPGTVREPLASLAYNHRIDVSRDRHAIERIRALVAASLGYAQPHTPVDYGLSVDRLAVAEPRTLVFLHGTARVEKCWPESHWVVLGQAMAEAGFAIRLPWGNESEYARAQRIAGAIGPAAMVLPRLDLNGMARELSAACAVVAVDTGLGHLAAALGVPAVSLYGPTDPARIGATGPGQQYLRADDGRMDSLMPGRVVAAVQACAGVKA